MQATLEPGRANKRGLLFGLTLAVFGIGFSLNAEQNIGSWLTLIGALYAVFHLHKLGRSGPA
ncbi:MAG: hypothetical protein SFV15_18315 [Polyangiaceae bacterium]|nr:hypothetical protein [Polyangiaceae bacterium]